MSIPITLANGVVAIYGLGGYTSSSGAILAGDSDWRWGAVDSVYAGGEVFVYNGDNVMFKESQIITRLNYGSAVYTLIPARLVTKEIVLL